MGISNTIPPSRLIQPGVVANTAARPTSPFTGQAIYQVDTNQMLIWNGTAWVIPNTPAQNPTGLELITPTSVAGTGVTLSGGVTNIVGNTTSASINGVFTSTYTNYCAIITGTASTDSDGFIRLRSGGTDESGSLYQYATNGWYGGTQNSAGATGVSGMFFTASFGLGRLSSNKIDFFRPNTTDSWKVAKCEVAFSHSAVGIITRNVAGNLNSATQFDGFSIIHGSTLAATVAVYGYRK